MSDFFAKDPAFWSMVDMSGGPDACWPFLGATFGLGYGSVARGGKSIGTHRYALQLAIGDIADGHDVCHRCDNPPCCNPAHLYAGTRSDNMRDATRAKLRRYAAARCASHGEQDARVKIVQRMLSLDLTHGDVAAMAAPLWGCTQHSALCRISKWLNEKKDMNATALLYLLAVLGLTLVVNTRGESHD